MDVSYIEDDIREGTSATYTDDYKNWLTEVGGKNNFSFAYLNIGSIKSKFDEIRAQIFRTENSLDIMTLAEINLRQSEYDSRSLMYRIDGYISIAKCRESSGGGGIMIYIRKDIQHELIEINTKSVEGIMLKVRKSNTEHQKPTVFLFLYRPPHLDVKMFISELKELLQGYRRNNFIVCGDINIDITTENNHSLDYEDLLSREGFVAKVKIATREAYRMEALTSSCIDHIYYRGKETLLTTVYRIKISDHYMICGTFTNAQNNKTNAGNNIQSRIDNEKFKQAVERGINVEAVHNITEPDQLYNYIRELIKQAETKATTIKHRRRKNTPQKGWISDNILKKMRQRDGLFQKSKSMHYTEDERRRMREDYKRLRNEITREIKFEKISYYKQLLAKNNGNMKGTWMVLNEIVGAGRRKEMTDWRAIFCDGIVEAADSFAQTFVEEVELLSIDCKSSLVEQDSSFGRQNTSASSIFMPGIEVHELRKIIKNLDARKGPGADAVSARQIKIIDNILEEPLTKLINLTLEREKIPEMLKTAIIKPIHKTGDKKVYRNYRPISILPAMDKIIERFVHDKITNFLEAKKLLDVNQYGFRRNRSTIDLLENLSDQINDKLNHRVHILCTFVDFSKAFDCIDRNKIVEALDWIGIRGSLKEWIKEYLSDRSFFVELDKTRSKKTRLQRGVVQGSIIGPLLYLVYINDICRCFQECKYYLYADDTIILSAHKNCNVAAAIMNREIRRFQKWCHDKNLHINIKKSKFMHIRTPHMKVSNQIKIVLHDHRCLHSPEFDKTPCKCGGELEQVTHQRYLGVVLDQHMSWEIHISQLRAKIRHLAGKFYGIADIVDTHTARTIYCALVESLLNYGITVWGSASEYLMQRLQSTQNCVISNLTRTGRADAEEYKKIGVLKVRELYVYRSITRNYFNPLFRQRKERVYNVRQERFLTNRCFNKYGERARDVKIPKMLNDLPVELRNLRSFSVLKTAVRQWVINRQQ